MDLLPIILARSLFCLIVSIPGFIKEIQEQRELRRQEQEEEKRMLEEMKREEEELRAGE